MKDIYTLPSNVIKEIISQGNPAFVYAESEILKSIQQIRNFWQNFSAANFSLFYSVKVNPNAFLLKLLENHLDGFDFSSEAEANLLLTQGIPPQKMTWSGPAKTNSSLNRLPIEHFLCIHLDSLDEWKYLQAIEKAKRINCQKSLRLKLQTDKQSKLGFSESEIHQLSHGELASFSRVHAYFGRESFSGKKLREFTEYASQILKKSPDELEFFLGPGLPSRYHFNSLTEPSQRNSSKAPTHIECGRAIVQSSGFYFAQIISVKNTADGKLIIVDGGLQHLAGYLESPRFQKESFEVQFWRENQLLPLGNELCRIQGSLSVWHDTILGSVLTPTDISRGDWVVVNNCGAYGFTAACNQFIGPTPIREYLLKIDGEVRDITPPNLIPYLAIEENL